MHKFKVYFWKYFPKGLFKEIRAKYKDRLRDYMNIYICDDFDEMYKLENKLENKEVERDYAARTWCYSKNFYDIEDGKYIKTSPCCGHIVFTEENFYMDTISHESTHAVIGYFTRKLKEEQKLFVKVDECGEILENTEESDENEELFCYMVGIIGDQIVSNYDYYRKKDTE